MRPDCEYASSQQIDCSNENRDTKVRSWPRTSGPGRPCSCALMCHGRSGLPNSRRTWLVQMVYRSSESIKRPSISNRHALIAGGLALHQPLLKHCFVPGAGVARTALLKPYLAFRVESTSVYGGIMEESRSNTRYGRASNLHDASIYRTNAPAIPRPTFDLAPKGLAKL